MMVVTAAGGQIGTGGTSATGGAGGLDGAISSGGAAVKETVTYNAVAASGYF